MPPWLDLNLIDTGHHLCTSNIYQIHQMIFLKVRHSNSLTRGVIVVAIIVVAAIVFFAVVVRGGGGGGGGARGGGNINLAYSCVSCCAHGHTRVFNTKWRGTQCEPYTRIARAYTPYPRATFRAHLEDFQHSTPSCLPACLPSPVPIRLLAVWIHRLPF